MVGRVASWGVVWRKRPRDDREDIGRGGGKGGKKGTSGATPSLLGSLMRVQVGPRYVNMYE
jgi:hypothetical protein